MKPIPKVIRVAHLDGHVLRLEFDDGLVREIDFSNQLEGRLFEPLVDVAYFARVTVDPVTHTIAWPNELDIDPEVLHGDAEPNTGEPLLVITEHRLAREA